MGLYDKIYKLLTELEIYEENSKIEDLALQLTNITEEDLEENDFVLCMGCQNSFPMDECEPLAHNSGYGEVYCSQCHQKYTKIYAQLKIYGIMMERQFPDLHLRIALINKDTHKVDRIIQFESDV